MSIFGQVWLWSLAAFLVGALLTWLVLVLPLRKSVRKLESALAQAHADAARTPANAARQAAPGTEIFARSAPVYDNSFDDRSYDEPRPQETSYPGTLVAASPINRDDVHDDIDEDFAELDAQVPPRTPQAEPDEPYRPEPERNHQPEPADDEQYRATTTQYLAPVAEPDDPYRAAASEYLSPEDEYAGEPEHAAPALSQLEPQPDTGTAGSLFRSPGNEKQPAPEPEWFDHEPQGDRSLFEEPVERTRYIGEHPGSVRREEPAADDEPQYAFADDAETAAGGHLDVPPETPAESTQVLPKRRPRGTGAVRGGFDAPQPIQPSMRTVERRDPDQADAHSGSLFEPSVQPSQPAVGISPEPPPAPPAREDAEDSVPPGPFGPGSAMPRPGGGRPSDGFAVKASVTALRYCTDESSQFPKMVAEVWFRTAEDAERVGFRPLS
jgi:hypothetical protein